MKGKMGLVGALLFVGVLLVVFSALPYTAESATEETGSTTMNVTVRGYVAINVSSCITGGIMFSTQDPGDSDVNATCNNISAKGGSHYNLTVDSSSTTNVNFTHEVNHTSLTTGSADINIGNLTYNANATEDNGTNLYDTATDEALISTGWQGLESCGNLGDSSNCWMMYYLNIPSTTTPGTYTIGYCWCGRQQGTADTNCGSCT